MAVALSSAPSGGHSRRVRAAIVVDLVVGLATLPIFTACAALLNTLLGLISPQVEREVTWWSVLLISTLMFVLDGAVVALLARLAARGQTPGLAAVRLYWGDGTGQPARRRLLGEPQFWCAALPALWVLPMIPTGAVQFFVAVVSFDTALSNLSNLIGPTLLVGALAIMIPSRRHAGRLDSRR